MPVWFGIVVNTTICSLKNEAGEPPAARIKQLKKRWDSGTVGTPGHEGHLGQLGHLARRSNVDRDYAITQNAVTYVFTAVVDAVLQCLAFFQISWNGGQKTP